MPDQKPQSTRHKLKGWIIESMLICISILLAFALDDWGEQRNLDARTNVAMCNVKEEMQFNYALLTEDYSPRHKQLIEYVKKTIQQLEAQSNQREAVRMIDRPIVIQQLRNTAWELAIETGYLLHVDFKMATKIAAIYDLQEDSYKLMIPKIIDLLFNDDSNINDTNLRAQKKLLGYMNEWVMQLKYLTRVYEESLNSQQLTKLDCA